MTKRQGLVGVAAMLFALAASWADEVPHLDFVKGLRERGYYDLALEYLEKLQKRTQPPLPADLTAVLPLELARVRGEAAGRERDAARREQLIKQARTEFQTFLQANAESPLAGEARLNLAQLIMGQARHKAFEAEYYAKDREQQNLNGEARKLFEEAAPVFDAAVKKLEERFQQGPAANSRDAKDQADRRERLGAYLRALYLQGLNTFEKALTFGEEPSQLVARGKVLDEAAKLLEQLTERNRDHPIVWEGMALRARCYDEQDKEGEAKKVFDQIMKERTEAASAGQRLVRYYRILNALRKRELRGKTGVRDLAEAWLNEYRSARNTREGQHVRYLLAGAYVQEVMATDPKLQKAPQYQQLAKRAADLLQGLQDGTGDFAEVAGEGVFTALELSGQVSRGPVDKLKTFDECLFRARLEFREADEVQGKIAAAENEDEQAKLRDQLKKHHQTMVDAARRGLSLPIKSISDDKLAAAHLFVYQGLYRLGQPDQALKAAEEWVKGTRKPEAALQAMFFTVQVRYEKVAAKTAESTAEIKKMAAAVADMEKRWPAAPQTDRARQMMGNVLNELRQPREAAEMWEKVTAAHPAYGQCSYFAGITYWGLHVVEARKAKKPIDSPSPNRDKAIAMLERSLKSFKPEPGKKMSETEVLAAYYLGDIYYNLGQIEKTIAVIDPLESRLKKGEGPEQMQPGMRGKILGLALRANVQAKKMDRATAILEALQKETDESDLSGGWTKILLEMGTQLKSQIEALKQAEGEAQLQQTRESFLQFLNHMDKTRDKLPPDLQVWLGNCYAILDEHKKAAEVFSRVTTPAADADQQKIQTYRASRLLWVRALRQSGQLSVADKTLKDVMARNDWAKKQPEFLKEQILIIQDQKSYATAIKQWSQLIRALQPHLEKSNLIKDVYNEANVHLVICQYMEAKQLKDKATQEEGIRRAAQTAAILKKNDFGGPAHERRFQEFLEDPRHKDFAREFRRIQSGQKQEKAARQQ